MNTSTMRHDRTSTTIIVLAGLVALLFGAPVLAGVECHEWTEFLETSSPNGFGPFTGPAEIMIGDEPHTAEFIAVPSRSSKFFKDGRVKAWFSDLWTFADGNSLIARSKLVAIPTGNPGEFTFTVKEHFNGGAGRFEKAFGKAHLEGIFQFLPDGSAVTMTTATGKLCF